MLVTVLAFIALLAVLVLVHEWGHFFAARRLGVAVEEFGFGFPPRLFGFKSGATTYSVNLIPLGGFVKLKGEAGGERGPGSFVLQPAWRRAIILVAGVVMNVVLAWALLSTGFIIGVPTYLEGTEGTAATNVTLQAIEVAPQSPASEAGLSPGDTVQSLDGKTFTSVPDLQTYVSAHQTSSLELVYSHEGTVHVVHLTPRSIPEAPGRAVLGVSLLPTGTIRYPWYQALVMGAEQTWTLSVAILGAFGSLLQNLVVHQQVPADVTGPVGIAVLTGQVARLGFIYFLQFAAMLSLNLAIINVLPIPALDGGRLLFVVIEKIRRKPNNEQVEGVIHRLGFAVLMLLVLAVTYRDVVRLSGDFWSNFGHWWGS